MTSVVVGGTRNMDGEKMILDVGSGTPSDSHIFLSGKNVLHVDIDRRGYHLETVCDIHHLPFRSGMFTVVHASHVLEHVENPCQAMEELNRVSSRMVIVKVPNATYYRLYDDPNHIHRWNRVTFEDLLKPFFNDVTVQTTFRLKTAARGVKRKFYTLKTLLLSAVFEPNELTATCKK